MLHESERRSHFLQILARLGVTEQELTALGPVIAARDEALQTLEFSVAVQKVAKESIAHFQQWCQEHGYNYAAMDEAAMDRLLDAAIQQVRGR